MLNKIQKGIAATTILALAAINFYHYHTTNRQQLSNTPNNANFERLVVDLDLDPNTLPDPSRPSLFRRLTNLLDNSYEARLYAHQVQNAAKLAAEREERVQQRKEERYQFRQERLIHRYIELEEMRKARSAHASELRKLERQRMMHFRMNGMETHSDQGMLDRIRANNQDTIMMALSDAEIADLGPATICGRTTDLGTLQDFDMLRQYSSSKAPCPGEGSTDVLLLDGTTPPHATSGENLMEFLHALQYSQRFDIRLGIMNGSWAMDVIMNMWLSVMDSEDSWVARFEEAFCIKIFKIEAELENYTVIRKTGSELHFAFTVSEGWASMGDRLRNLWKEYNTGDGTDQNGSTVQNMCSGIDALFGEGKSNAIYSVIYTRTLTTEQQTLLDGMAEWPGIDPEGAKSMTPDYIKSILQPLGMLHYPIILITDGQDFSMVQHLLTDAEIGPQLRLVPEEATWDGGDITLAVMSNVLIANPASSYSAFIARSRLALGFGHSYLFRAKNENGEWYTVCGDDCIFDSYLMPRELLYGAM